ncbi:MAG: DUF3226 domain-containing protein [Methylococcaceae bacterium]
MMGEYAVSKSLLIVEGKTDKLFIEQLIKNANETINTNDLVVDIPICNIDGCECLNGLDNLKAKLKEVSIRIDKEGISKIGILVDADNDGKDAKLNIINDAIKSIDPAVTINAENTWFTSEKLDIQLSCYVLNVNGYGELEDILRLIKAQPSPFADCLEAWRYCLQTKHNQIVSDKDFKKRWFYYYSRYDCCDKKETGSAEKNCSPESTLQKDHAWDFNHEQLSQLKTYLSSFN